MYLSVVHIITMPLNHLWPWMFALGSHSLVLVIVFLIYNTALSWSWSSLIEGIILKSILFASRLETLRVDFYSWVSYKIKMELVDLPVVVACSDPFLSPHLPSLSPSSLCALCINKVVVIMNLSIWFCKIRLWIICKMPLRQAGSKSYMKGESTTESMSWKNLQFIMDVPSCFSVIIEMWSWGSTLAETIIANVDGESWAYAALLEHLACASTVFLRL